ncbi:MAG: B12-binding domain-containing radical SAM protein [Armatimonadetes bacterium]|nr:B12-binding domain-containing radical SAM protein [Armatimonadota bacterium]
MTTAVARERSGGAEAPRKPFTIVLITIYSVENAGIRYVSATLKRAGFNVYCVFLRDWRHNLLEMPSETEFGIVMNIVREKKADLIGVGFMSSLYQMAQDLTLRLKAEFPSTPVIWGGIHPTSVPEECIEDACDMLCVGEGEEAMLELVERMARGEDYTDVRNIWVKKDGQVYKNPLRPLLQNLDWLPYPDIDEKTKYYVEANRVTIEEPWLRTAEYRIYFSRGCPYNCSYCYVSILRDVYEEKGKKYYRHRSVGHIIGEMLEVKRKFKRLGHVKVDDDTSFAFGQDWLNEFCAEWKRNIDVPFECLLIPPMLREDLLEQLQHAGLFRVQTGIESGSAKESKEIYNRAPGNKSILKFGEFNKRLKLDMIYDVIIDNPHATEEMKLEMADFMLELERPYKIYFYSLTYFPGTMLTKQLLASGALRPDEVEGRSTKAWKQFRVSMDWPRSDEDRFYLAIYSLVSKDFVPKKVIRWLLDTRGFWKRKPWINVLYNTAWVANLIRMLGVALEYWRRGDLTWFKIRQYGNIRKLISQ